MATEGERKVTLLFQPFKIVDFAFALSILSFTRLNRVDPRATGIPETMIKERESRDEKRVKTFGGEKKKRRQKRENRAREQDERPPESYPRCLSSPLSQWGH